MCVYMGLLKLRDVEMTKTKLEILGPYTPEHEGPFCTRSEVPVDLKYRDGRGEYPLGGYLGPEDENITTWAACGKYNSSVITPHPKDLMNAREVPVAREFWIYDDRVFASEAAAKANSYWTHRIIHVREVLLGDGE